MSDLTGFPVPPRGGADIPATADTGELFRWSPLMTVVWTLVIGIVTVVAVLVTGLAVGLAEWFASAAPDTGVEAAELAVFVQERIIHHMSMLTVLQAGIVIVLVLVLTRTKAQLTRTKMLALEPISVVRCAKWVAGGFIALVVLTQIPRFFVDLGQAEALDWMELLRPAWLGYVLLVVMAPLSEELLFRGFVYGGLSQSRLGPVGAIIVASAIWTLIHVQYTWLIMTQVFIYGVVFGVMRWKSGSLWPPIIAHGVVNLIAGIVYYGV